MDLKKLEYTDEELNKLLGLILTSKSKYNKKLGTLEKYIKVAKENNYGKLAITGAEEMEHFEEYYDNLDQIKARAKELEKDMDKNEDFNITRLWVEYRDGTPEHKLVDLIW